MAQSSLLRTSFKRDFALSYTTAAGRLFTFCGGRQNSRPNFPNLPTLFTRIFSLPAYLQLTGLTASRRHFTEIERSVEGGWGRTSPHRLSRDCTSPVPGYR